MDGKHIYLHISLILFSRVSMLENTIVDQRKVEESLLAFLRDYAPEVVAVWDKEKTNQYFDPNALPAHENLSSTKEEGKKDHLELFRRKHLEFLQSILSPHSWVHELLYMSQTWVIYWAVQAGEILGVLDELFRKVSKEDLVNLLFLHLVPETSVRSKTVAAPLAGELSGFAGAPHGKGPHLLATYAACCALCILDVNSLRNLPREEIKRWLLALRNEDGSFCTYLGGETDLRCTYAAAVTTSLLGLDDPDTFSMEEKLREVQLLTPKVASYAASCQSYEGGFACTPSGCEAHAAYTFCGLGALFIMREMHRCYLPSLLRWLAQRQMSFEGGFNGRTNKLVDACYSFWAGASHIMVKAELCYRKFLECCSAPISSSSSSTHHSMVAKEMALLHYGLLIDLEGCLVADEELWEKKELSDAAEDDLVAEFLSADDAATTSSATAIAARKAASAKLAQNISKQGENPASDTASGEGCSEFALDGNFFFDQHGLQSYILACCQDSKHGGLRDKPTVDTDAYHTCYSLAGLSLSQNLHYADLAHCSSTFVEKAFERGYLPGKVKNDYRSSKGCENSSDTFQYGTVLPSTKLSKDPYRTLMCSTHPAFNINKNRIQEAWKLWGMCKTLR